jgi:LAO/AO transport system kinase
MEIGDIFVVNKADREGANRLQSAIEAALALKEYAPDEWRPPILKTVATSGDGIGALVDAIDSFHAHASRSQAARRRARTAHRLRDLVARQFVDHLEHTVLKPGELDALVDRMAAGEVDPYTASRELLLRAGTTGVA